MTDQEMVDRNAKRCIKLKREVIKVKQKQMMNCIRGWTVKKEKKLCIVWFGGMELRKMFSWLGSLKERMEMC